MAKSSSSQNCGVDVYALHWPSDETEDYEDDQFNIVVEFSTNMVVYPRNREDQRKFEATLVIRRKSFKHERQAFLSGCEDCQRQLIRDMIRSSNASDEFGKNLGNVVSSLLKFARDCAQRKLDMEVVIEKTQELNLINEHHRAREILDDWLCSCNNAVSDVIYCWQSNSARLEGDCWIIKANQGTVRYDIWNQEQDDEQCCCSICLNELRKGTKVMRMPLCSHKFHGSCVFRWFVVNPTCPICRSQLLQESIEERISKSSETPSGGKVYSITSENVTTTINYVQIL